MNEKEQNGEPSTKKKQKPQITPYELLKNSDYISYFKATEKYKELYNSHDANYSFIFSAIVSVLLVTIYKVDTVHFFEFTDDFLGILIGGYFGLLGFIVGAVAIILGLINNQMIDNMQKIKKFNSFMNLFFMYAFTALLNLWVIAELIILKIIVNMPFDAITDLSNGLEIFILFVIIFLLVHLPSFTVIYATYLVRVSLELLFVKYVVEKSIDEMEKAKYNKDDNE